jgi:hypothetical protein
MKQKALQVLKGIHGIVKDDQMISRLLPQLGEIGLPYAQQAGDVARALGYGRKKQAPAKKRAPAKRRGRGVPVDPDVQMYSAVGKLEQELGRAVGNALAAAAPASGRPRKQGKGFGNFLKGLIQAPLAGVAALSGGLHGAVGGFGRKPRARRAKKPTHIMLKL